MSAERTAIVTGTSTGLGEAVARQLLERGWSVIGIARRPAPFTHERYRHVAHDLAGIVEAPTSLESQFPQTWVRRTLVALALLVLVFPATLAVFPGWALVLGLLALYAPTPSLLFAFGSSLCGARAGNGDASGHHHHHSGFVPTWCDVPQDGRQFEGAY